MRGNSETEKEKDMEIAKPLVVNLTWNKGLKHTN